MTTELQNKLTKTFPWMDCFVECGWDELVWNMCREIDDAYYDKGCEVDIEVLQVKEKFGMLRIYYGYTDYTNPDIVSDIIAKYERLSTSTCEFCGDSGEIINEKGWLKCVCKNCERIW